MTFPLNHLANGGTEYMARGVNKWILPTLPKFQNYKLLIIPGEMSYFYQQTRPVILWLHNPLTQLPQEAGMLFKDPLFLEDLKFVIVPSEWHRERMIATTEVDPEKFVVIPNAIHPVENDITRFNYKPRKIRIIHASTQDRGMEILIPAAHMIDDDFELQIFNDFNPDTAALEGIEDVVLDPRFTFYGPTPHATVLKHMAQAHIHAYPGYWEETSCLVQIEALSANLLTVINDQGALPETSLGHGMVVPMKGPDERDADIEGFAYSLSEAIGIVRSGLWVPGTQAEDVNEHFSWDMAWLRWNDLHSRL